LKRFILVIILMAIASLVACATPPNLSVSTSKGDTTAVSPTTSTTIPTPKQTIVSDMGEEDEIKDMVANFGKRLQNVSLLAPDAAQEIQDQYSEFVSPTLLDKWMHDVSNAPGRRVSSPWPDHIEITTLSKEDSGKYTITGYVIEVTSTEVLNGGAAARIPIRMTVQKDQGSWYITEYTEEH
jgi:hypothetical protein